VPDPNVPEEEFWELPEKQEGYDVYQYDARRAAVGQKIVLMIFTLALILFILSNYFSCRASQKAPVQPMNFSQIEKLERPSS
jgi:hypothetical protein